MENQNNIGLRILRSFLNKPLFKMRECLSIHIGQAGVQTGNVSFFLFVIFLAFKVSFLSFVWKPNNFIIILFLFSILKLISGMLGTLLLGTRYPT